MGTLTINFEGICTHFTQNVPVPHRVVLVNATNGPTIDGVAIPPHQPTITIAEGGTTPLSIGPLPLTGVTIAVQNATGSLSGLPPGLPLLSTLMAAVEPFSAPSPGHVVDGIPQWVACYFDLTAGSLSTFTNMLALAVQATVTTNGDPILTFTPFQNAAPLAAGLEPKMTLPSGSTVTISNQAPMDNDYEPASHFLLHYLTAGVMPTVPQLPPVSPMPNESASGGCSNSGYP